MYLFYDLNKGGRWRTVFADSDVHTLLIYLYGLKGGCWRMVFLDS